MSPTSQKKFERETPTRNTGLLLMTRHKDLDKGGNSLDTEFPKTLERHGLCFQNRVFPILPSINHDINELDELRSLRCLLHTRKFIWTRKRSHTLYGVYIVK